MRTLHITGMTPPALAIAIALQEKGLDFTVEPHRWQDSAAALAAFDGIELANTLEGEFPILVDGAAAVSDSYFILEYLDDAYPTPPLRPADAYGQWQVQALARFFGERALPAVSTLSVAQRFDAGGEALADADALTDERRDAWRQARSGTVDPEVTAEAQRKLGLLFERIESLLGDGDWLVGDAFGLGDIAAYALVRPFLADGLGSGDAAIGARTRAWFDRIGARPAVRAAIALGEPAYLPGPEHARWG